jgi:cell division protein ZapA (FtsZ GTPase activity inhibitor)
MSEQTKYINQEPHAGESSLEVMISGRTYPLKVEQGERELILKAAVLINRKLEEFGKMYRVSDKQDLFAMTSLFLATQFLSAEEKDQEYSLILDAHLEKILATLESV